MTAHRELDVVVLGLGPGGEQVATELAHAGLDVVAVERDLVGGECPYWACVPTKIMTRAAAALGEARRAEVLAATVGEVRPTWDPVAARIRRDATADWDDSAAVSRLAAAGVRLVRAHGRIIGPRMVQADGQRYAARRGIVLATGSRARTPHLDGLPVHQVWTTHDLVAASALPRSVLLLGGGAVGCEFAQVLARFGTRVTLVEEASTLLPDMPAEVGELLASVLGEDGVDVCTGARVAGAESADHGRGVTAYLSTGRTVTAERLVAAIGRTPNSDEVGLDSVAVRVGADGRVPIDDHCRAADGLWALGDVAQHGGSTHVSVAQARVVIADVLGQTVPAPDYAAVPRVTFTDPPVASVGLAEHQARAQGREVHVVRRRVAETSRGHIHGAGNDGTIVLVSDGQVLLGATVMAPAADEIIGMLTLAVHARVPLSTLRTTMGAFPTLHRDILEALADSSPQRRSERRDEQ